jgi:hypothetical protein
MSNQSPQSKRGGSSSTANPKRGSVKTTANMPKEQRPGVETEIARQNKAYWRKMNGPL